MEAAEDPLFWRRCGGRGSLAHWSASSRSRPPVSKTCTKASTSQATPWWPSEGVSQPRHPRPGLVHLRSPSDRRDTFDATVDLAEQADLTFAQFVLLTPFPGTIDFEKWAAEEGRGSTSSMGAVTRHWLLPADQRPKLFSAHPTLSLEEIRVGTQHAWDRFYGWRRVWARSRSGPVVRSRLAFVLVSKLYRQMVCETGMPPDSDATSRRVGRPRVWAALDGPGLPPVVLLRPPMPELAVPGPEAESLEASGVGIVLLDRYLFYFARRIGRMCSARPR